MPDSYEQFPVESVEKFARDHDRAAGSLLLLFERKADNSVDFKDEQARLEAHIIIRDMGYSDFVRVYAAAARYIEHDELEAKRMCQYVHARTQFWIAQPEKILAFAREKYEEPDVLN